MWPFSFRKVLPRTSNRPRRSPYRPRLEALEDRRLLSAGALDATFGSGGVVTTLLSTSTNDYGYRVAVQPDGKVIAAGEVRGATSQYGLVRYNPNGILDTSFGQGGIVIVGSKTSSHYAFDVALQPNGKIDVTDGLTWTVLQFNANGTLDTTFGNRGQATIPFSGYPTGYATYCRLAIQPPAAGSAEGKIVVAGNVGTYYDGVVGVARLNPGGRLDTSFGNGGTVTTALGPATDYAASFNGGVALQGDGKIVIAGVAGPSGPTASNPRAFVVARYNANGSLDGGFGSGGIVKTVVTAMPYQGALGVVVQPGDGKIVAVGSAYDNVAGIYDWSLVRYNPDGSLDCGFGSGGVVLTATNGSGTLRGAAVGNDGNIVVAGDAGRSFAVGRYLGSATTINGVTYGAGSPDPTFGSGGITTTSVGVTGTDTGSGLAMQPDGKIVVAGYAQVGSYNQFVVLRYLSSAPQIGSFTATPNPVTAGGSVTLTAANIIDSNPNSSVTQVAFYRDANGDGVLQPGTDTLLGYGTRNADGTWTLTFATTAWASGTYTLFAQAKDNYGVFGDPVSLTLQVM